MRERPSSKRAVAGKTPRHSTSFVPVAGVGAPVRVGPVREKVPLDDLTPGTHAVVARALDPTPWVRDQRADLEQSVTCTVELSAGS